MSKILLLYLLIVLLSLQKDSSAQSVNRDSLRNVLKFAKEDTATVHQIYTLGYTFYLTNSDSCFLYYDSGLTLSKKINYSKGEGIGDYMKALLISNSGNNSKALDLYLKSLQIFEKLDDKNYICGILINISSLYDDMLNERKALEYSQRAYKIATSAGLDEAAFSAAWGNGYYFTMLNMPDSGLIYFEKCYQLAAKAGKYKEVMLGMAYSGLGFVNSRLGNGDIALPYLYKANGYLRSSGQEDYLSYNYGFLAELYFKQGKSDSAISYYTQELETANKINYVRIKLDAYEGLIKIYAKADKAKELEYHRLGNILRDSLYNADKNWEIQNLTYNEQERQKEIAAKQEEELQQHKKNIQYAGIAIGAVTFLIAFLLLSNSIIVNEKVIKFLGIVNLLILFEFINLLLHSYLEELTNRSPILMLLMLVAVAAIIIPVHHRIENFVTQKMVAKNKKIRLAAAKKTIAELETTNAPQQEN